MSLHNLDLDTFLYGLGCNMDNHRNEADTFGCNMDLPANTDERHWGIDDVDVVRVQRVLEWVAYL